ncbi:MAG TPA: imidazole glycerol phosphate synthase subunit HisH [Acidocella sp.]|jgi:glutamine amidotransferase|uniref:imidazole glycerol phosphate synthase subunit HisH n=1 Tax=Acidocella sp. TaxID=50710 RepID=UPI002D145C74|nr:imidazole glycerol phosphate synthase subunit HisH [Acidocella sp.]HVE22798.1 imidazole glycerol phosphate synthase subunit HisH [Acidocella sp.]
MLVAVVDYGSGNLASAARGLSLAAEQLGLTADIRITADPDLVGRADRIVLPGQGAFADCAAGLAGVTGLKEAMMRRVAEGAPFLGICVGMQLMAERGLEFGVTEGFGWVSGEIAPLPAGDLRLPHMGWNELTFTADSHPLLAGLKPGDHAYFVHSFALAGSRPEQVLATTEYGGKVVAMVAAGNCAGTQFHVEKSQQVGLRILGNFLRWSP